MEWGPPSHLQQAWNLLNIPQPAFKDLPKRILLRNRPWWSSPCDPFCKKRTTATNAIPENNKEPGLVEQCQLTLPMAQCPCWACCKLQPNPIFQSTSKSQNENLPVLTVTSRKKFTGSKILSAHHGFKTLTSRCWLMMGIYVVAYLDMWFSGCLKLTFRMPFSRWKPP